MKKLKIIILSLLLVFIIPFIIGLFVVIYAIALDSLAYHYETKNPEKSIKYIAKLYKLAPNIAYSNNRMAVFYYSHKNFKTASIYLEQEIEISDRFQSHKLLCHSYYYLDHNDLFAECSEDLVEKFPDHPESLFLSAFSNFIINDLSLSQDKFIEVFRLSNDCDALSFIIGISNELNNFDITKKYCAIKKCTQKDNIIKSTIKKDEICSFIQ